MSHTKTPRDRRTHLKVKIKTLAAEAHFIRAEERKALARARHLRDHKDDDSELRPGAYDTPYQQLYAHRVGLGHTARCNLLAYGFLRGVSYARMERYCAEAPDWDAVSAIARRFRVQPTGWLRYRIPWDEIEGGTLEIKPGCWGEAYLRTALEHHQRWEAWLADAKAHLAQASPRAA